MTNGERYGEEIFEAIIKLIEPCEYLNGLEILSTDDFGCPFTLMGSHIDCKNCISHFSEWLDKDWRPGTPEGSDVMVSDSWGNWVLRKFGGIVDDTGYYVYKNDDSVLTKYKFMRNLTVKEELELEDWGRGYLE